MTTKIVLEIETCIDCPRCKSEMPSVYRQTESDYSCGLLKRKLARNVEWASEMPPVPDDCPLRLTNIHRLEIATKSTTTTHVSTESTSIPQRPSQ